MKFYQIWFVGQFFIPLFSNKIHLPSSKKFDNPVMEVYRGKKIRKYNTINIRVSYNEMIRFIDAKIDSGMSEREAIVKLGILCPCAGPIVIKSNYAANNHKVS